MAVHLLPPFNPHPQGKWGFIPYVLLSLFLQIIGLRLILYFIDKNNKYLIRNNITLELPSYLIGILTQVVSKLM